MWPFSRPKPPNVDAWGRRSSLVLLLLTAAGGLAGGSSEFEGGLPALGGPNGVLFDATLKLSEPWRRDIPAVPVVFVAIDDASLARPELAALPRALFQPIWARLIDGLSAGGARRIAFDVVLAYAGADFRVGTFALPDYDRGLADSLARGRDRIVLGRFPTLPPAAPFAKAVGASRIGLLDVRLESDGRVRSTAALARLPDGRIALGFAALAAGWSVSQASSLPRILIVPPAPLADTPAYSLGALLDCLDSVDGAARVREAVEGRIVVVGTAVLGEDEHRGPTRFLGRAAAAPPADPCRPRRGLVDRPEPDTVPGALLQIAAIQSAASEHPVTLAPGWLRTLSGSCLALLFGLIALRDETALTIGEQDASSRLRVLAQMARSAASGLAGPSLAGCGAGATVFVLAGRWLPMGYPALATSLGFAAILGLRWGRHRAIYRRLYRTAGRYLPPARLAALARSGFGETPQGQEREVTILLADLVGFTTFSNGPDRTASEVVAVANRYFTLMQAAIDRHAGCSDKFLGDAVLAFWNGLSDDPDHALKAVAAARDILGAMAAAEASAAARAEEARLGVRAVVCSGRVYVGDLGARQRSNFTIIGPAVNEIFRLEKLPDLYGLPLLVAGSTATMIAARGSAAAVEQALGGGVLVRLDDVELKGFAGRRAIHAVVPGDDPGLASFIAGRHALDQRRLAEALEELGRVDRGALARAARVVTEGCRP